EGLVLRSPISSRSIHTDPQVVAFSNSAPNNEILAALLLEEQRAYLLSNLSNTFLWNNLTIDTHALKSEIAGKNIPDKGLAFQAITRLANACNQQFEVAEKFRSWLMK